MRTASGEHLWTRLRCSRCRYVSERSGAASSSIRPSGRARRARPGSRVGVAAARCVGVRSYARRSPATRGAAWARPLRLMCSGLFQHQPHRSLSNLPRILAWSPHGSSFSNLWSLRETRGGSLQRGDWIRVVREARTGPPATSGPGKTMHRPGCDPRKGAPLCAHSLQSRLACRLHLRRQRSEGREPGRETIMPSVNQAD